VRGAGKAIQVHPTPAIASNRARGYESQRWTAVMDILGGQLTRHGGFMVSVWDADHWRAFIRWTELRRIAHELRVGPRQALVDLGCGLGGPGLWLAAETGADLTGIDLVPVALEQARQRADRMGIGARSRFQAGDFEATGLPADSFDAAVSVDVVSFVQHKPAAFHEVARILRPGSYFGFTTWESDRASLAGVVAPQVADYRPLLRDAGFVVENYEEPPGWRERQSDVYQRTLSARSNKNSRQSKWVPPLECDRLRDRLARSVRHCFDARKLGQSQVLMAVDKRGWFDSREPPPRAGGVSDHPARPRHPAGVVKLSEDRR
jgi:SAM-dependent methyltransferase